MGSMITLAVGKLEVDWGKNEFFRNHSKLFLRDDIAQADYEYADDVIVQKPAYVRKLATVVARLELLGYTLVNCRRIYADSLGHVPDYYPRMDIEFEDFARALAKVDVGRVSLADSQYDFGEFVTKAIFGDPEFIRVAPEFENLSSEHGHFFENLDAYVVLRLLAENPRNLAQNVVWHFQDVVNGGWVERDEIYEGLDASDRYLVVTEGSSDSSILKATLPFVAPEVSDFFEFIDMSEGYPFTGTGNVVRFCQGLAKIHLQNKTLVVLDNDVVGNDAFRKLQALNLPVNMRVAVLPALDELRHVRTLGPAGETIEDVNGKAAAIECFLDLTFGSIGDPVVRWTSFNSSTETYQGELVAKEQYTRAFFASGGRDPSYNLAKLRSVWLYLLAVCSSGGAPHT